MKKLAIGVVVVALLAGCVTLPENTFVVSPEQLARRQIETRRYDGAKEEAILIASSNVLQDLGFTIDNSETKLGLIVANKQRDATHGGEIAAAILIGVLTGAIVPISKDQTIRVSVVVRPLQDTKDVKATDSFFVRVTFQRIVRRSDNSTYAETLSDKELYEGFFEKLSKSIFLEAQKI